MCRVCSTPTSWCSVQINDTMFLLKGLKNCEPVEVPHPNTRHSHRYGVNVTWLSQVADGVIRPEEVLGPNRQGRKVRMDECMRDVCRRLSSPTDAVCSGGDHGRHLRLQTHRRYFLSSPPTHSIQPLLMPTPAHPRHRGGRHGVGARGHERVSVTRWPVACQQAPTCVHSAVASSAAPKASGP